MPTRASKMRLVALVLAGLSTIACGGGTPLPTPQIIYVTPAPTASATAIAVSPPSTGESKPSAPPATPTPTASPTKAPTARPTPTRPPQPTPIPTPEVTLPPGAFDPDYQELTEREWAAIVRSPDDHQFETITVYGCISQFDTGTGEDAFRAQTSYKKERFWFTNGDNALFFTFTPADIVDYFNEDVFRAEVSVAGAYTYETTIGGQVTVPWFWIDSIEHLSGRC